MAQATRPWGDEIKARVRVAMEYGDQTWDQVADTFGISKKTVQRWLHEDSVSGESRREKLAQLCGVPPWFMAYGFPGRDEELDRRVDELVTAALVRRDQEAHTRRDA